MPDIEKVKTGLFEMLQRDTWKDIDPERSRFQPVLNDALELLKAQQPEIIYCADCPKKDREECEKQYGRVQNEWNCRFGRRKGREYE